MNLPQPPNIINDMEHPEEQQDPAQVQQLENDEPVNELEEHENQDKLEADDQIRVNEYIQDVTQPLLNHGNLIVQHYDPIPTPPFSVFEIGSSSNQDRGTKLKADDIEFEEFSPSYRQQNT
ncbi:unnamed protein product, partial [Brassica oleracea]